MNRHSISRLLALAASIAVIVSCDSGSATGVPVFNGGTGNGTIGNGGAGGGSTPGGDGVQPIVVIDTPAAGALVNLGDSVLVAVRVRDAQSGIASVEIAGLSVRGDVNLGTQTTTTRYSAVRIPAGGTGGTLPPGTARSRDTVFRRYIFPVTPLDTLQDSLVIRAIAIDASGAADTAFKVVRVVAGPRVNITTPTPGDSVLGGTRLNVTFRATHGQGVSTVRIRVRSDSLVSPAFDTSFTRAYTGNQQVVNDTASILIPKALPGRTRVTVTAEATDINRIAGAATPVVVFIRATPAEAPRVTQVVPARSEINDTIAISATGDGFRAVGFIVRDSTGATVRRDSVVFTGADQDLSPRQVRLSLNLTALQQGRRLSVVSFAIDRNGTIGFSVPANATASATTLAAARADSTEIVYGRTYTLPRPGIAADIAVDATRGHVFVSNTSQNRVELWQNASRAFDADGVRVGAEPWGMTIGINPDELLVANSGGTNISKVSIAATSPTGMSESRILTRNTVAFTVSESIEESTAKIRTNVAAAISYSDRPQYIAQSASGTIYFSTRPTPAAPAGTLRFLDPSQPFPETRQIFNYGTVSTSPNQVTFFNIDAVGVARVPAASIESDTLILCDHPSGTTSATVCARSNEGFGKTVAALLAAVPTSDVEYAAVDVASLAWTDTTFVGWSGNREWIAFGQGRANPGRVVMAFDPAAASRRFSSYVEVTDLVDNASDRVFGLALDQTGRMLGVHGSRSYFSAVETPFHLRKQGRFDSGSSGAGITYHPLADINPAVPGNPATRLAFVASANGTIDIVDAYYYASRGRLRVKENLYGPLRASLPLPGDAANVVLKLYGLTSRGLVVIDVTAQDIKAAP